MFWRPTFRVAALGGSATTSNSTPKFWWLSCVWMGSSSLSPFYPHCSPGPTGKPTAARGFFSQPWHASLSTFGWPSWLSIHSTVLAFSHTKDPAERYINRDLKRPYKIVTQNKPLIISDNNSNWNNNNQCNNGDYRQHGYSLHGL